MFRKISLLLVLVLVIGALSACSGGPGTNLLDEETREAVEKAWYERGESWKWVNSKQEKGYCYYGNFGGYAIVFAGTGKDTPETQRIGGFEFEYGTGCQLYAYTDDTCTLLQTLYEEDKINLAYIKEVADYHRENGTSKALSDAQMLTFQRLYMKMQTPINWKAKDGQPGSIRYLGKHSVIKGNNNIFVCDIFILSPTTEKANQRNYTEVGGYTIAYPCEGSYFFGYYGDHITSVLTLYEAKLLDDTAIAAIAAQNEKYN